MSSHTTENTSEMPIIDTPTFQPNNLYYGLRPKYGVPGLYGILELIVYVWKLIKEVEVVNQYVLMAREKQLSDMVHLIESKLRAME